MLDHDSWFKRRKGGGGGRVVTSSTMLIRLTSATFSVNHVRVVLPLKNEKSVTKLFSQTSTAAAISTMPTEQVDKVTEFSTKRSYQDGNSTTMI